MARKYGRHTPAFLLLFLTEGPDYGGSLLRRMESDMPFCFTDSPGVYRCLQELEKDDLVSTEWKTDGPGRPQKWYTITDAGRDELAEQAEDIRMRRANMECFLSRYSALDNTPSASSTKENTDD